MACTCDVSAVGQMSNNKRKTAPKSLLKSKGTMQGSKKYPIQSEMKAGMSEMPRYQNSKRT
jgi:hypothetical protein